MSIILNTIDGFYCIGKNNCGQLGLGDNKDRKEPTELCINLDVISVHNSTDFTIILATDGLYSCGRNKYGQLGLGFGHSKNFNKFQRIDFDYEVYSVSVGNIHTITYMETKFPYI